MHYFDCDCVSLIRYYYHTMMESAKTNLNLRIKTEPVAVGADPQMLCG